MVAEVSIAETVVIEREGAWGYGNVYERGGQRSPVARALGGQRSKQMLARVRPTSGAGWQRSPLKRARGVPFSEAGRQRSSLKRTRVTPEHPFRPSLPPRDNHTRRMNAKWRMQKAGRDVTRKIPALKRERERAVVIRIVVVTKIA